MANKIHPLSNVRCIWDHDIGGYPERIRLAMEDGTIATYALDVRQPAPQVEQEYKPKHLKKPVCVAAQTDRREMLRT